ncbi:MAG: hypothetical protein IJS58_05755 [Bacilli bacterium]|nr:hypothetical protein [Bacilli bacterium]
MNYALLKNYKIYEIKNKIIKKVAPKKDLNNPQGLNKSEKEKVLIILMKKFNISEEQANKLLFSTSGNYREELLSLENRENEIRFNNIVETGKLGYIFRGLKYSRLIKEEIITSEFAIIKATPKIVAKHRSYIKELKHLKLQLIDNNGKKVKAIYCFKHDVYKDGFYLPVKKYYNELAKSIKGSVLVSYTAKSKYIVSISKDLDEIMNK